MKKIFIIIPIILLIIFIYGLYLINIIPHKKYTNDYFKIKTYTSLIDMDNDGIDDQTDILNSVRKYLASKPKYKSKYYANGYPDDNYGVCTDVVAFGLLGAGYNLQELINEDIKNNNDLYNIKNRDKNIDFRRVNNIKNYLDNHAISLTTDLNDTENWQGGDIVVFKRHIGIISDNRNKKGIPFLIHHVSTTQVEYEEDSLKLWEKEIVGHYRIS